MAKRKPKPRAAQDRTAQTPPEKSAEPELVRTHEGMVWTDGGRANARRAVAELLESCEIPKAEWQGIIERAIARGGSNLDVEREVQRWLSDHGGMLISATSPYVNDETLARVAKRFRRKAIGDGRVNSHLDRLDQRDALPPADPAGQGGPWSLPDSPKRWATAFKVSSTTIVRWFKARKIRNKRLSDKSYQVHVDDLPEGYERK